MIIPVAPQPCFGETSGPLHATRERGTWPWSCHCGEVAFEIDTDFPELTTCDCLISRRRNALMAQSMKAPFACFAVRTCWSNIVSIPAPRSISSAPSAEYIPSTGNG